jgi:hypothetical protein
MKPGSLKSLSENIVSEIEALLADESTDLYDLHEMFFARILAGNRIVARRGIFFCKKRSRIEERGTFEQLFALDAEYSDYLRDFRRFNFVVSSGFEVLRQRVSKASSKKAAEERL